MVANTHTLTLHIRRLYKQWETQSCKTIASASKKLALHIHLYIYVYAYTYVYKRLPIDVVYNSVF